MLKRLIYFGIIVALGVPFLMGLFDPNIIGVSRGELGNYGPAIDQINSLGQVFVAPVTALFYSLGLINFFPPDIFPVMSAEGFHQAALNYAQLINSAELSNFVNSALPATLYPGGAILWYPLAAVIYSVLFLLFDPLYERASNLIWNVVVEYLFHRKKAQQYAKELDRRAKEMEKVQDKMYTMAQETNSLRDSVITDELTKVFNKRFFLNHLMNEFENCRRNNEHMNLIMLDIDHFKKLNDGYGHVAGDEVLKAVAGVIKRFTPEQCYACRFGGEEFGIIVPRRTVDDANNIAREFQEHIQKLRFPNIDEKLRVTISQGVCAVDFTSTDGRRMSSYNDLLELADQQLYRSKTNGRNRVSTIVLADPNRQNSQQPNQN